MDAVVLKDEILRLSDIPLVIRMPGMAQVARGAQVKLDILRWDELDLSVEARLLEVLGQTDLGEDEAEDEADADADMSEEMSADSEAETDVATSEDAQAMPETEPQDAVDTGLNAV